MGTNRYEQMFLAAQEQGRGVFIPFLVVGDPNMAASIAAMEILIEAGADALELGIPFSDPVADGPTIQAAVVRALKQGATPDNCFEAISRIRDKYPRIPIGILTYANAVMANGMTAFFKRIQEVGVDSVLTADIPVDEADEYVNTADHHNVSPVFIAPPNADDRAMKTISRMTKGYTYVVARKGVTGSDDEVQTSFRTTVDRLIELNAPPSVVGFGISKPEHVRDVLSAGAKGAISGSAVVNIIANTVSDEAKMKTQLTEFVRNMKVATQLEK